MKLVLLTAAVLFTVVTAFENPSFAMGRKKNPAPVPTSAPAPAPSPTHLPIPQPTETTTPVEGSAEINFGEMTNGGTGCPDALVTDMAEDHLTLRFVFDDFLVDLTDSEKTLARKNCAIAVPFEMASAKKLVISKITLSGAQAFSLGTNGEVNLEAFFAGAAGRRANQQFEALEQDISGEIRLVQSDAAALACGSKGIFRINSSALVQKPANATSLVAAIRADEILVELKLLPCQ